MGSSIRSRGARLAVRERDGCWIAKFGYRNSEPSQIDSNLNSRPYLCATAHKNLCVKESSFEVANPAKIKRVRFNTQIIHSAPK